MRVQFYAFSIYAAIRRKASQHPRITESPVYVLCVDCFVLGYFPECKLTPVGVVFGVYGEVWGNWPYLRALQNCIYHWRHCTSLHFRWGCTYHLFCFLLFLSLPVTTSFCKHWSLLCCCCCCCFKDSRDLCVALVSEPTVLVLCAVWYCYVECPE
jgi:hypothetical protein